MNAGAVLLAGAVALHATVLGLDGDVSIAEAGSGSVAVATRGAALGPDPPLGKEAVN